MTIFEAQNFYKQDLKKYELNKNAEFLNWLNNLIENGYSCYISVNELQELINNITYWYEIKYPNRELDYYNGMKNLNFNDIKSISNVMNIRQLMYRLSPKQLNLIECDYRSYCGGSSPIYKDDKLVGFEKSIGMQVTKKEKNDNVYSGYISYFLVIANAKTGIVEMHYDLEDYISESVHLEDLLTLFNEKYKEELDFKELKQTIYNHKCDLELRKEVLELAALSLLYSKNTNPEYGYERAKRFINEFNKKQNLNLSTIEIDEIMSKDYTKEIVSTENTKDTGNIPSFAKILKALKTRK